MVSVRNRREFTRNALSFAVVLAKVVFTEEKRGCEENPSTGVRTAGWELAEIARGEENGTQMREYSGFPQTPRLVTRPPAVNMASAVGKKYDLCMVLVQRAGIKNRRKPLLVREALETQMWTFGQAFRGRPRPRAGQRLPRVSQTKSRLRG